MRRTKIVATVGPSSSAPDVLRQLLVAGVDVFRLNFSHSTHRTHGETYRAIRDAAAAAGRVVAVMQDLSGPKIRTGPLEGGTPLELAEGERLRIAAGDRAGSRGLVYTPYAPLVESARPGDRLLLDDGRIELRVTAAGNGQLETVVVNGGALGQNKGINAPGVALPSSAVTEKDEHDLRFGLELGVDLVALSFVQTAEDVEHALQIMRAAGRCVPVIAKIERPAAVDNLDSILTAAHGVMVARGDLGLEMPLEQVPRVQKRVIRASRAAGLPVILATQVFESMRVEPRPTRAEVSDAANAVDEGADAIMLAGETAAGAYPVRTVETLDAVIRDAEQMLPSETVVPAADPIGSRHGRALCEAAVTLAATAHADAIVAVTREGKTARLLASLRPMTPVFAASSRADVASVSALLWGIIPVLTPASGMTPALTPASQVEELEQLLVDRGLARTGAAVVFVNVSPELNRTDANFINVRRIG
jgi:pyruvate kinase